MSLHGLGVIGAQVAASIKSNDEKIPDTPKFAPPRCSITSSPGAHSQEFDPSIGAKPCSPFYPHSSPTISHEQLTFETKNANRRSHMRDIESLGPYASCRTDSPRRSKLWEEENKPLTWLQTLTNKQRMALKAVVAVDGKPVLKKRRLVYEFDVTTFDSGRRAARSPFIVIHLPSSPT
ncbi:hypothetical protein CBS147332_4701 [Penicillium roqueforti]|nr:hypothetical protein CBS147332_4701 [Penicillium roqueforti]KAI3119357.1 hypothetical protein CBS147331_2769 [Penicillium roqueforti]KAI3181826.1 hypothetical protein DTO046C5_1247 [Penicillium roqueforti]